MGIATSNKPFDERVKEAEADNFMRASVAKSQDAQFDKRTAARRELGNWEGWRDLSAQIRQHTIKYLPDYLEEFSDNVKKNGGHVFFAKDDKEASGFIKELAIKKHAKNVVKSKSMVTTEIDLDKTLLSIPGLALMETDLAEFILQEDNWDEPTHIVFPTLHKNRDQIQKVFQKIGYTGDNVPEHMAKFVRQYLRNYFMKADFGITGCNFAVANNGMINLVTNEGNADLTMAIPKTQVVVMGMERIVPSLKEAETLDNILSRSAVGQKLTSYCSFSTAKKVGEADGPDDFYVVIVDNGRSKMLNSEFEPMLQCIRCGSCLNVCPVYRQIGGKGYGSIYPGPMGDVLSPILGGYQQFRDLPYACSLCAACTETCPVKIPLHDLIRKHRYVEMDQLHLDHSMTNALLKTVGKGTASPALFADAMRGAHIGLKTFGKKTTEKDIKNLFPEGKVNHLPAIAPKLVHGWVDVRDLAVAPKYRENFRHWYKKNQQLTEEEQKND
jgi:L-lactate dehydrogenase complex protein LldF